MGLSLRGHLTTTSLSSAPGWSGSLTGGDPYETRTDTSRPWLLNMTWSWCFISHATASHPVVLARETLLLRGPQRRAQRDDPPRHGRTRDREAQIVAEVVSDASLAPVPDLRQKRHPALLRVGLLHVGGVDAHDRVLSSWMYAAPCARTASCTRGGNIAKVTARPRFGTVPNRRLTDQMGAK